MRAPDAAFAFLALPITTREVLQNAEVAVSVDEHRDDEDNHCYVAVGDDVADGDCFVALGEEYAWYHQQDWHYR